MKERRNNRGQQQPCRREAVLVGHALQICQNLLVSALLPLQHDIEGATPKPSDRIQGKKKEKKKLNNNSNKKGREQ